MAIVRREDGVQFVVQSYRELLTHKNPALLKNEIRFISKTNGEYARLFKLRDGQYEAAFSREPGYLLGETVWHYFGKPADLIYCEALPDEQHAVVVIVRSGSVYLDAKLPLAGLEEEFVSLTAGNNRYIVYTFGDVPLTQEPTPHKFSFEAEQLQSFTRLKEPLFANLPINDNFKLLSIEQAIRTQQIDKGLSPTVIATILILIAALIYWFWPSAQPEDMQPVHDRHTEPTYTPSELQAQQLRAPAPVQVLQKLSDIILTLYSLTGWQAASINYDGSSITVAMQSVGGSATMLLAWAKTNNATATLSAEGARLVFPANLPNRTVIPEVMKEDEVTAIVLDKMLQTLPGRSVHINPPTQAAGGLIQERLAVSFKDISTAILVLIGKQLNNLPVKLTKCSISLSDGLLSGQLELLVIGD